MTVRRTFPPVPMIGVGAVVLRGASVLLIKRARPPRQGEWSLPGGLQKLGETVFAAAAREVLEETGVTCTPLAVVEVIDLIEREPASSQVRYHYTLIDVVATWTAGEPRAAADALDARWVACAETPQLIAWPETLRVIRCAQQMRTAQPPSAD